MSNTLVVTVTTTEEVGTQAANSLTSRPGRVVTDIANLLTGIVSGNRWGTIDVQVGGGSSTAASGTVTLSSGSGTVGAIINGVTVSVTWATSDTASATALKTAINASANALIAGHVTATSSSGVVTITAVNKGTVGNSITLAATGTGATASGARLTGGAAAAANSVTT
jgi:phage tail sheath gpL-like